LRRSKKDKPVSRTLRRASALAFPALALALLPFTGGGIAAEAGLPAQAAALTEAAPRSASPWARTSRKPKASHQGHRRTVKPSTYKAYTLKTSSMTRRLDRAPLDRSRAARRGRTVTVAVPAPTGELIDFAVVESPVLQRRLQRKHPEIRTYAGTSVTDGFEGTIRLDRTPLGFHASVITGQQSWYVDPAYIGDTSLYLSYFGSALPEQERPLDEVLAGTGKDLSKQAAPQRIGEGAGNAVIQRVYRLALVTDRSYAEYVAPGLNDGTQEAASDAAVLAAKATLMNRVNQIYNDDLAIKMVLVNNSDLLNLNTTAEQIAAGFPKNGQGTIEGGCTSALLNRNQTAVDDLIGETNYDIGHIALGINGGGIAQLGVVGQNGSEARGCTGLPFPVGDFMAVDYVAHEMGHQFSGNHTFNGSVCSGQRNAGTSVEPGGGSSVMAYAGICDEDDLQPHSDPYFSQRTQTEVSAYVNGANTDTRDGFQQLTTTNHNPTVTAPAAKSIPLRTPFTLTGSATDSDGDPLVYLWEQNNTGGVSATSLIAASKLTGPLFRVFGDYADVSLANSLLYSSPGENLATSSPSRTFPDMAQVLAGSTNAATGSCPAGVAGAALPDGPTLDCHSEFLPTALYTPLTMTFRLTARDQVATGGGTQFADTVLTIDKLAGPLLATSQATNVSYAGGSTQAVTWNVNSTNKPTLAPNVRISLSTDGGQTFPTVLAASTPNDGSEDVTIPNVGTTEARLKIEAVDNYFFDVNDAPFTITVTLANLAAPTISGTPTVGSLLTADPGTWTPGGVSFAYQWYANGLPIAGADQQTFTPTAAQEGKFVAVHVTGSKAALTSATASSASVRVASAPITNTIPPLITGSPTVGATLTLSNGTWSYGDLTFTYQWYANGAAIRGANQPTYVVSATMVGRSITGRVTASRPGSDAVVATSSNSVSPS
jgi:hypothetical protein